MSPSGNQETDPFTLLFGQISGAIKKANTLYVLFMGFLSYCGITLFTTPDHALFFNESVKLPIVNVTVNFFYFCLLAPMIAVSIFVYLHFFLGQIEGFQKELVDKYGRVAELNIHPWLFVIGVTPNIGPLGQLQKVISFGSFGIFFPFVLLLFPAWYSKLHDPIWTYLMAIIPIFGLITIVYFWNLIHPVKKLKIGGDFFLWLIVALWLSFFLVWGTKGYPFMTLDLRNVNFSKKTEDWRDYKGSNFEGADLRHSTWEKVNLEKSNFREARLEGANLAGSNLKRADFTRALLKGATLVNADLTGANFESADLRQSTLEGVNLEDSYFWDARLEGANLAAANLKHADLDGANLKDSDLTGANFESADLKEVNMEGANVTRTNFYNAHNLKQEQINSASCFGHIPRLNKDLDPPCSVRYKPKRRHPGLRKRSGPPPDVIFK